MRQPSFRLDKDKLEQLEPGELVGLVQHYMDAHDAARKEIKELEVKKINIRILNSMLVTMLVTTLV